eukprot:7909355-Pyramimonas_sp.AAC.1
MSYRWEQLGKPIEQNSTRSTKHDVYAEDCDPMDMLDQMDFNEGYETDPFGEPPDTLPLEEGSGVEDVGLVDRYSEAREYTEAQCPSGLVDRCTEALGHTEATCPATQDCSSEADARNMGDPWETMCHRHSDGHYAKPPEFVTNG